MSRRTLPLSQNGQTPCFAWMKTRHKLYCAAAGLLLIALVLLLWPSDSRPLAPVAPTRSVHQPARPASISSSRPTRAFTRFAKLAEKGELPKLTREQTDVYLQAQHRSAGSLLAIFHLSKDEAFLREAMEKFPDDPQVLLTSLQLRNEPTKRLEILANLKRVDPDNSMADCLSARILFDLGKSDEAISLLSGTFGKSMSDYNALSNQNVEEAYLSAGYSAIEAKLATISQSAKPLLMEMPKVADGLKKQRVIDASAGNEDVARFSREIQLEMARQLQEGHFVLDSLVGMNLEKKALKEIGTPEAQAQIEDLNQQTKSINEKVAKIPILNENPAIPESDWLLYFDRVKLFGEKSANDWIIEKYPEY